MDIERESTPSSAAELPSAVNSSWFWLNKKDAAKLLKVQPRQLERRVEAGQVQKQVIPRKPWQRANPVVFSRSDIEAILRGEPNQYAVIVKKKAADSGDNNGNNGVVTIPDGLPAPPSSPPPSAAPPVPWNDLGVLLAGLAAAKTEKPWLTLREAVEYSGLPLGFLVEHAKAGNAHAVRVGKGKNARWMFSRKGLTKIARRVP